MALRDRASPALVLFGTLVCSRMTSAQRVSESGRTHQKISPSFAHAPWENMINSYPCHCPKNPSYVFVRFILCIIVCYPKACIYVSRLSFSFLLLNFGVQVYDFSSAFTSVLVLPQQVASSIYHFLAPLYLLQNLLWLGWFFLTRAGFCVWLKASVTAVRFLGF